ncbi:NADP-dependent oxidoreductase [Alteromonas sp. C1M14]|uniref:NADP-dependent oxidoreductase n=1 Tax=Alteromonas sp. C1M14 TaxID=2841567 RepID=UPI001C0A13F4|nr:NADP-dependent oxidoreductase [Alteromonas sp. C1M14]MBU2980022.1 NADP-dependent oxidoreductase [Alteromonas sp. C1M14]
MTINKQVILKQTPENKPAAEHFSCIEGPMPALADGQVLVRNLWLSIDPYMRSQISGRHMSGGVSPGDVMIGETIAEVVSSKSDKFSVGEKVRCKGGWQQYAAIDAGTVNKVPANVKHLPHLLSILGMPGLTAYAGLIWKAQPKAGDTVVIAAATGAVASSVIQLAKSRGCRVVGIAGGQHKCDFATSVLGADACIDRHQGDLGEQLDKHCPDGIDIYFDLVGCEMLDTCCERLAIGARVILCGLSADYNRTGGAPPAGPSPVYIIKSRATVMGLVVFDYETRRNEFIDACLPLVDAEQLTVKEQVIDGLALAGQGLVDLLAGDAFGKVVVKID